MIYSFTAEGTSTAGSDYPDSNLRLALASQTMAMELTVPTGVSSFTVTYSTTDDTVSEATETLILSIGAKGATSNILDNDTPD